MAVLNYWDWAAISSGIFILLRYFQTSRACRNGLPLPPGPRKLPVIGNLLDIPASSAWKTYTQWGKIYNSDIVHVSAAGNSIVILNSYKSAKELLEKRSAIYSSRPISVMLGELSGFGFQFVLMPYGDAWRTRRRLFNKYFNPSNAAIHQVPAMKYMRGLLGQLLKNPEEFAEHIRHMSSAVAISMTYGVDVLPSNDPNIQITKQATAAFVASMSTGSQLVDAIPALKHLPTWFPGASFHKVAKRSRECAHRLYEGVFNEARHRIRSHGTNHPSFVSLSLESLQNEDDVENLTVIKDVAGVVYMAAADTTSATIQTFMFAMVCFPEVQKKAQHELDRVLGGRLPTHDDVPLLPYISALVKEVFRWKAVVPTGVAHLSTEADVYRGYYIPKNSIVIANAWAMFNNETDYPNPTEFKPERYLTADGQLDNKVTDPTDIVFGFGRRICPGIHIGLSTVWIAAASILAIFDLRKAEDENGNVIEPSDEFTSGGVSHPLPYTCSIKPRSSEAARTVRVAAGSDDTRGEYQ